MVLILLALGVISVYTFGMWIYWAVLAYKNRNKWSAATLDNIATFTFRLGLCGTIALGFLGLLLKG